MRDLAGTTIGHYEVGERLGAGGMAVVYRAVQQPLGRVVALKALAEALAEDGGFLQRFENEARTLASLDHPHILPIYDFDREAGIVFLTMPLVKGGSLRDLLDKGRMHPAVAWRYIKETCDALHHAHEAGIIHRDLKPANVLIHADGRALLADFGLARSAGVDVGLTGAGFVVGTPGYMAPEQVMGRPLDRRADIYSMGVMVFEMLTGRVPYPGDNSMEIAIQTVNAPIPSACALNPALPDDLDRLIQSVLAKDPAARPPTMQVLVDLMAELPQYRTAAAAKPAPTALQPATLPTGSTVTPDRPLTPSTPSTPLDPSTPLAPDPPVAASAVLLLEQLGVSRLRPTGRLTRDWHWSNTVHVARAVCGPAWPDVARAAGIADFLTEDPPTGEGRTNPIENLSRLNEAFESVFGLAAPDKIREWGRRASDRALAMRPSSGAEQRGLRLVPGQQQKKLQLLLKGFNESMDAVRGEPAHTFKQMDDNRFWIVHYQNLFALGRRKPDKSCQIWTANLESLLRWAGLANNWFVEEIECGCVTGTYNCVFAVHSSKA